MVDTSAFDQPEARGLRLVLATLRVTVAAACVGAAGEVLLANGESPVVALLLARQPGLTADPPVVARVAAGLLFAAGMFSLTRPCWPVLLPLAGWFGLIAATNLTGDSGVIALIRTAATSGGAAAAVGLLLLDLYPPRAKFSLARFLITAMIVRLSTAVVFAALGAAAIHDANFGGPGLRTVRRIGYVLTGSEPDAAVAGWCLSAFGAVQIGLALCASLARVRFVAAAMIVVAFVAVSSEVFLQGPVGVATTVRRLPECGLPATLFFIWWLAIQEQEGSLRPRST